MIVRKATASRRTPNPSVDLAFMLIREYHESDLQALRAIHAAQGFDYALPDLRNPLFVTRLILTDASSVVGAQHPDKVGTGAAPLQQASGHVQDALAEHPHETAAAQHAQTGREGQGEILGAALLRLTAEAYLLLDPRAGTPRERWQWLLALHEAACRDAWQRGLEDVHAWLPPPIAKKFGRRLERLGWLRDDAWTPYCKRLFLAE
jgi:hypothetical protein